MHCRTVWLCHFRPSLRVADVSWDLLYYYTYLGFPLPLQQRLHGPRFRPSDPLALILYKSAIGFDLRTLSHEGDGSGCAVSVLSG